MINKPLRDEITALIKREVVPAIGCTEPMAVALCVAKARETLGTLPDGITVTLSGNMLKNAMGVGIPGTGMTGLPVAIALGALKGNSDYGLEVLRDVTPADVEDAKKYMSAGIISVKVNQEAPSKLYVRVDATAGDDKSCAIIAGAHTNFIYLAHGGDTLFEKEFSGDDADDTSAPKLKLATVWEYATESPVDELRFILEARRLNLAAAESALEKGYGHALGYTIRTSGTRFFGDTPVEHMLAYTSAACDARMAGVMIPVMSNSGSGNQGITATMPVVSFAMDCGADEQQTIRALTLSHLTSIYIKQSLGRLSALCGCVVASTGASAGIVYLMGGGYDNVVAAVKNMVANLTGMICDGAKPSCAMKITSGVSTALMSAMLAMNGRCVTSTEGIVSDDVDDTIRNLTSIGRDAMTETDKLVLRIMTSK